MFAIDPTFAAFLASTKLNTAIWILFAVVLVLYLMKRSSRKTKTNFK